MGPGPKSVFHAILFTVFTFLSSGVVFAQTQQPSWGTQQPESTRPPLTPEQLDTLVAPIALYPDTILSQALAASTYPLELVEASQWSQQHPELRGSQMIDAARQFNWDPSVQAMVVFPDVLRLLTQNIMWTTDLGNAFLEQPADVMAGIQRMRAQAQQNGQLASTPEQVVTPQTGPDQSAIAIQPADPQVLYVPAYNPAYVWGPPVSGAYPALDYPAESSGYGFGPGLALSALGSAFSALSGWSGWGWGLNWLTHGLFTNGLFFNLLGLGGGGYGGFGGGLGGGYVGGLNGGYGVGSPGAVTSWAHNPVHRLGVPYRTTTLARSFGGQRGTGPGFSRSFTGSRGTGAPAISPYRGGRQTFSAQPANANSNRFTGRSPASSNTWRLFGSGSNPSFASSANRPAPSLGLRGSNLSGRTNLQGITSLRGGSQDYQHSLSGYRGFSGVGARTMPRSSATVASQHFSQPKMSGRSWSGPAGGGHFSAPRSTGHFKAPRAPSFKAPKFKAPKFSSHSGGHSGGHGGGHSKGGHHR